MHTSISLLQPLLCFCSYSSPLWRHLYSGGIIFIVSLFSTLCDTCAWASSPGKREGTKEKRRLPRPYQGRARCHHVLYLDPRSCGVSSGRGPNRAYPNLLLLIWTFSFLDGGVTKTQYVPSIMCFYILVW